MSSSPGRVSPVAMGLLLGFGACTAACGLVVGAGDYVVGGAHDGGPAGTGGDADMDAQPVPDAVGPGSDSTPPPDAGPPPPDDGPTTTSDGGPAPACAPGSAGLPTDAAFQQLVKACVLAATCDPVFFPVTVSQCIATDYLDTHFATKCLAGITSCADYYACQGTRIATPSECSGASGSSTDIGACNGTVATACFFDGNGLVSNCAALGGTCTVYHESATTSDTGAGCEILPSCADPTDGSVHCSGSSAYTCVSTDTTTNLGIAAESCATGSTCWTDNDRSSACLATTTACTATGTTCSGDNLTTCESRSSGNELYTNSCSVAGLACTPSSGGTAASCTAPGCANSGCTESCLDVTHLQACIGGAPYVVDCTSLGFNVCASGSGAYAAYNFCAYQ